MEEVRGIAGRGVARRCPVAGVIHTSSHAHIPLIAMPLSDDGTTDRSLLLLAEVTSATTTSWTTRPNTRTATGRSRGQTGGKYEQVHTRAPRAGLAA